MVKKLILTLLIFSQLNLCTASKVEGLDKGEATLDVQKFSYTSGKFILSICSPEDMVSWLKIEEEEIRKAIKEEPSEPYFDYFLDLKDLVLGKDFSHEARKSYYANSASQKYGLEPSQLFELFPGELFFAIHDVLEGMKLIGMISTGRYEEDGLVPYTMRLKDGYATNLNYGYARTVMYQLGVFLSTIMNKKKHMSEKVNTKFTLCECIPFTGFKTSMLLLDQCSLSSCNSKTGLLPVSIGFTALNNFEGVSMLDLHLKALGFTKDLQVLIPVVTFEHSKNKLSLTDPKLMEQISHLSTPMNLELQAHKRTLRERRKLKHEFMKELAEKLKKTKHNKPYYCFFITPSPIFYVALLACKTKQEALVIFSKEQEKFMKYGLVISALSQEERSKLLKTLVYQGTK